MLTRIRTAQAEDEGGFTLIELLVVIIIIGILAAIAIPVFLNQRQKGYDAQAKSDARNLATLEQTYLSDNNVYLKETNAAGASTDLGYKPSGNVTAIAIEVYSDGTHGTVASAGGGGGFCISATSQSTKVFYYDSGAGGFSTTACPAGL
jgi:type IV pilus assembly protein PilA